MANTSNQLQIICPYCEMSGSGVDSITIFWENENPHTRECEECGNTYIVHVDCKFTTVKESV